MTFIDFFSGIGGFRLGMEQAGHVCLGHCEKDKFARKSYTAIHEVKGTYRHIKNVAAGALSEGSEFFATDICGVRPEDLPDADCYCGGFPCQSFSIAGKRGGFNDTRGTLFFEVMRLAKERQPTTLFLENVEGLLNHDNGNTFETILRTLDEVGYDAEWQCLNSKNFGVPQNRERVFIIAHLRGRSRREVFPIRRANGETLKEIIGGSQGYRVYGTDGVSCTLASKAGGMGSITGLYLIGKDGKEKKRDYASCLTAGGHSGGNYSDMDLIVLQKTHGATTTVKNNETGTLQAARLDKIPTIVQPVLTPDRPEKRQNGRRFKEDGEEMFTLTAQDRHGVMLRSVRTEYGKKVRKKYEAGEIKESRHNLTRLEPRTDGISNTISTVEKDNLLLTNARIRRLTPLECWRLQGFPDWAFYRAKAAGVSDSQLYKQAGNSVSPPVVYEQAKRL